MTIIEVYADIGCPFTQASLHHLLRRRAAAGRPDLRIRARAWPLELVNGEPLAPELVADEIEVMRAQVDAAPFAGFDAARFPHSSLPALDLAELAYAAGDEIGEAVSVALRDEVFLAGHDVADPVVLRAVAERFDLGRPGPNERAAVLADWRRGEERGVQGSPHYFCGDVDAFCPWLDVTKPDGELQVRTNRDEFDRFFARCLER